MAELDRLGDLLPPEARAARGTGPAGAAQKGAGPAGASAPDDPARRVAEIWADTMGPEVAANARPVQLRDGRLVVTTSSAAWAQTLQLMSPMVVERLNAGLGEAVVTKAVFRHAGWDPAWNQAEAVAAPPLVAPAAPVSAPSEAPASTEAPVLVPAAAAPPSAAGGPADLSAEERQALDEVDRLPLPPAVKDSIRQAMLAGFVRARQDSGR